MSKRVATMPRSADFAEYIRQLPKLLKNGDEGRIALIREARLISVWDTAGDALQAGLERFGSEADFLTQPISRRDLSGARRLRRSTQKAAPS